MGLQTVPAYIGQAAYQHPVELDRNILEGIFSRTGLFRIGDFTIAPTATAQQISITAGRAFLLGAESLQQGGYVAWSDNTENKVFGPPSGSARIDSLILRVVDTQYGSDPGTPRAEWDIVAGVPSGSPTARPDSDFNTGGTFYKPGAWWRVADVRINVGDTVIPGGQITRNTRYVRQARGDYVALSTDTISDQSVGDSRYDTDTLTERVWNGTVWENRDGEYVCLGHVTAGTAAVSTAGAEAAIPSATWAIEPTCVFKNKHIYRVEVHYALGPSSATAMTTSVRLRKGAQTVAGQVLGVWGDVDTQATFFSPHYHDGYIKNTSGADISTTLSLTVQRTGSANNVSILGDATTKLTVVIKDLGLEASHKLSPVATAIV